MFYNQLIKICKERGVKPTPLLASLGLSTGNLKNWKKGAPINSDTLVKIADYFNVPTDYFLREYEETENIEIDFSINPMEKIYNVMKAHPEHIASLLSGQMPSKADLIRISEYLGYSVEYLVPENTLSESNQEEKSLLDNIPTREMVDNIMIKASSGKEYNFLQVRISKIIISNLARKNISKDKLEVLMLSKKKLDDLYNNELDETKIKPFNLSDITKISEAFNLSRDFMYTGK